MKMIGRLVLVLLAQLLLIAAAGAKDDFLSPDKAYRYTTRVEGDRLIVAWDIERGYYLYKKKMGVVSATAAAELGEPLWPQGEDHTDEYFGTQEIYRGKVEVPVPIVVSGSRPLRGCGSVLPAAEMEDRGQAARRVRSRRPEQVRGRTERAARQEVRSRRQPGRFPAARRSVPLRRGSRAGGLRSAHLGDRGRLLPVQGSHQHREHHAERADR